MAGKGRVFTFSPPGPPKQTRSLDLSTYPTIHLFDGRLANRPFLLEMPDPVTMITWDGLVEVNPEDAERLRVEKGDVVAIRAGGKTIEAPVFPYVGIKAGTIAMPIGHDHTKAFGRYVENGASGNPRHLAAGQLDEAGGVILTVPGVPGGHQQPGLQPLHRDARLQSKLPVEGAKVQLVRL